MPLTERLEIRLSPAEKDVIERAARKHGLSLSDYVRFCCHRDFIAEMQPEAIKRLFQAQAQNLIEMSAAGRAATLKAEERRATEARVVARARRRLGADA